MIRLFTCNFLINHAAKSENPVVTVLLDISDASLSYQKAKPSDIIFVPTIFKVSNNK